MVLLLCLGGLLRSHVGAWLAPSRSRVEARFRRAGLELRPVATAIPAGRAGAIIRFDREMLRTCQVYLTAPANARDFVHIDATGRICGTGGTGTVTAAGERLVTPCGNALFVDGVPRGGDMDGWTFHWVVAGEAPPGPEPRLVPRLLVEDGFMRREIGEHSYCRVSGGVVGLAQHGGGMATTSGEVQDADFQRAVNPFSVFARDCGWITYDVPVPELWADVHVEARFYFGVPKTGNVVDTGTLPTATDMLVVQGPADGFQAAFGWLGAQRCFALVTRQPGDDWAVAGRWTGQRPPLTNWVKIGLDLRHGYRATGWLDGVAVVDALLPLRVRGPFHVLGGKELTEFDDVAAWSLPAEPGLGSPVYVISRSFAGKRTKRESDPPQFQEWAESTSTMGRARWYDAANDATVSAMVTSMPLFGDLFYEAVPTSPTGGELPTGKYRIVLLAPGPEPAAADRKPEQPAGLPGRSDGADPQRQPRFSLAAVREADAWLVSVPATDDSVAGATPARRLAELRLCRSASTGDRVCLRVDDQWVPVSSPVPGPVHVAVLRSVPGRSFLFSPSPNHHLIRCRNLVNELFEEAPTDWSWVDGSFRMDCRWACEDQWAFMACGSPALPCMTSKRTFSGDQVHEYFVCLRSAFPWDAGDPNFDHDPARDRATGFSQIIAHHGWYSRRDLNFSFCTDGHNPLSGYAVVFGGDDNTETRLLRQGRVVAATREARFLFPTKLSHLVVHWNWWKFTVRRFAGRVVVRLNDELLFDYLDPEPLAGGHLGFWSVRNGFALSRLTSVAERIETEPQVLYVADSVASDWQPLLHDSLTLRRDPATGLLCATSTVGGGFLALRYQPESPVDLRRTPVLELPFRPGPGVAVNLHLAIGGQSFLVDLGTAPLTEMKSLLAPEFERGECFQIPTLTATDVARRFLGTIEPQQGLIRIDLLAALSRLPRPPAEPLLANLTLGNTSNSGYLLAGSGGNQAGVTFAVGPPRFLAP